MLNEYVVVRSTEAGVHVGVLREREGNVVLLEQSRRIWSWTGALTLSEISVSGVGEGSKVAVEVRSIYIRNWCELIACSSKAETQLRNYKSDKSDT